MKEIILQVSIQRQRYTKLGNNATTEFVLMQHGSVIPDQWFYFIQFLTTEI